MPIRANIYVRHIIPVHELPTASTLADTHWMAPGRATVLECPAGVIFVPDARFCSTCAATPPVKADQPPM